MKTSYIFILVIVFFLACGKSKDNDSSFLYTFFFMGQSATSETQALIEVKGVIRNTDQEAIADANLSINKEDSTSSQTTSSTTTDSEGVFTIYLGIGKYNVIIEGLGSFVIETKNASYRHVQASEITGVEVILTSAINVNNNANLLFGAFEFGSYTRLTGVSSQVTVGGGMGVDSFGNLYITGHTEGGLEGNVHNAGSPFDDVFIKKFDSNGNKEWTKQIGVNGASTWGWDLATDTFGNVYIVGHTEGGLDGNTLTGFIDVFVMKYDSSGNRQWTRQTGVSGFIFTEGRGVATDNSGNVYVTGYTEGGLDGNSLESVQDIFLIKYDSAGNRQWTRQTGRFYGGQPVVPNVNYGIAVDQDGNIYISSQTDSGLEGNTLTGSEDVFVMKYDSNGNKLWTRQTGGTGGDTIGIGLATDNSGNVYVAGHTNGGLDGNTQIGSEDVFVIKYDSNGNRQWTRQTGVSGANTEGHGITTDNFGNVYVAGHTNGGLDGNTLTGSIDVFAIKYDSDGNKKWTKQMGVSGGSEYTEGYDIVVDSFGNPIVTGKTNGSLDGVTKIGSVDMFITSKLRK